MSLTHLTASGQAQMVDVGDRSPSRREAVAEGWIRMQPQLLQQVCSGDLPKGDVVAVARIAAIQAAKRTWELIPLCHPIPLTAVAVAVEPVVGQQALRIEATVRTHGPTGVEMEALTAVQVGLLAVYDMCKAADPAMEIGPVRLRSKQGGRNGAWQHPAMEPMEPHVMTSPEPA